MAYGYDTTRLSWIATNSSLSCTAEIFRKIVWSPKQHPSPGVVHGRNGGGLSLLDPPSVHMISTTGFSLHGGERKLPPLLSWSWFQGPTSSSQWKLLWCLSAARTMFVHTSSRRCGKTWPSEHPSRRTRVAYFNFWRVTSSLPSSVTVDIGRELTSTAIKARSTNLMERMTPSSL